MNIARSMSRSRSMSRAAAWTACALSCVLLSVAATAADAEKKSTEKAAEPSRAELQQKLEAAQKRLDVAAREVADLSMSLSDDVLPRTMAFMGMNMQRAVLGVNIGTARGASRDDGVEVVSVSPGGAAAEAGIKAGDVLTEVNGKSLKRTGDEAPRTKLLTAMREIEPESKVTVKYVRDGKTHTASVTAMTPADRMFNIAVPFRGEAGGFGPGAPPFFAFTRAEGVFGAAELVPLTPKLGQYFGVDKGLLVVRAPADSRLKLEEGDVIVDIDGRVPSSPTHALRILGSYQAGEQLKLNVLRMKKRLSFDITIPADADARWERGAAIGYGPSRGMAIHALPAVPAMPVVGTAPMPAPLPPPPPPDDAF